jgi:endo-1,3-1,4-beta-glycanase ExoK
MVAALFGVVPLGAEAQDGSAFVDRFTTVDGGRWTVSHGWANGAHQNCTWARGNLKVADGIALSLTNEPTKDRPFTCAELQSTAAYGYGTYEVRMRAAAGPGLVSAFFTYTGPPHGRPHDEIDFEFLGKAPGEAFVSYFASGRVNSETAVLGFDSSTAMHAYAFEWSPDAIRWYADGRLIREAKASEAIRLPVEKQKIYISIWNGTGWDQEAWLGRFAYPGHALVANFEYVAFTPLGAACQFPESIVCKRTESKVPAR